MDGSDGRRDRGGHGLTSDVMHLGVRLGAAEADLKQRVTFEKMMTVFNDLQRFFGTELRDVEQHVRDMLAGQNAANDKRFDDMQKAISSAFGGLIDGAVTKAIDAERAREAKAREDVENKAKDAVRGLRLMMWAVQPMIGGALVVGMYLIGKFVLHWRF